MKAFVFLLTALLFTSLPSSANQRPSHPYWEGDHDPMAEDFWLDPKNELSTYLDQLSAQQSFLLLKPQPWQTQSPKKYQQCSSKFKSIIKDGQMTINLTFGYSDNYGETLDAELHRKTYEALSRTCRSSRDYACGFRLTHSQNHNQQQELTKTISLNPHTALNPSTERRNILIKIRLAHSSHSTKDKDNLIEGVLTPTQLKYTSLAEDHFFSSIAGNKTTERCDACIYYGHARDGGGPDFSPVPQAWRKEDGKPNYSKYQKYKYNYAKLISSLLKAKDTPPQLIGLFACYSHLHFWKRKVCPYGSTSCEKKYSLRDFSSNTESILTPRFSQFFNWEKTLGILLDHLIGFRCNQALTKNYKVLNTQKDPRQKHKNHFDDLGFFETVLSEPKVTAPSEADPEQDPTEHYSIYSKPNRYKSTR